MRQESAFEHDAVSRVGARGLMQLMPATASFIANKIRSPTTEPVAARAAPCSAAFGLWWQSSRKARVPSIPA